MKSDSMRAVGYPGSDSERRDTNSGAFSSAVPTALPPVAMALLPVITPHTLLRPTLSSASPLSRCPSLLPSTISRKFRCQGLAGSGIPVNTLRLSRCLEVAILAVAFTSAVSVDSSASALPFLDPSVLSQEPSNALSLPTWAIHVSSVAEWVAAMALVWEYGEKSGLESWKGLSWGMVPLLGGALCACTWHFFYNSEQLEVLVALQASLTVLGNLTMCIAAYRIHRATQKGPGAP